MLCCSQLASVAGSSLAEDTALAQGHADGDPKLVKIATQQCKSAVQAKAATLAQKYGATGWIKKINRVAVGSDGVYVCNVFVSAVVAGTRDEELWDVSGYVNKAAPVWLDGKFSGSKI